MSGSSASAGKPPSNALQVAAMRCCANGRGVHAEFDDGEELDVFFLARIEQRLVQKSFRYFRVSNNRYSVRITAAGTTIFCINGMGQVLACSPRVVVVQPARNAG